MRLALVADTFPPLRTSGAVQLRDLSRELVDQGHQLTVLIPEPGAAQSAKIEQIEGYEVVRLKTPPTKDIGYLRRVINEFRMPFAMRRAFRRLPQSQQPLDGIVFYSPSIFHGPLVSWLKQQNKCGSYLIIRDIFPEWAADMGLMRRGFAYYVLKVVTRYQYWVADVIGVQTPGNLAYFPSQQAKVEVLHNWLRPSEPQRCSIDLAKTCLAGRHILVYAGNMGVAQGVDVFLRLAQALNSDSRYGFLFVGRGSDVERLKALSEKMQLSNILFLDEIDPDEIPSLYANCTLGLVSLDPRHKTHNIPGKFVSYMHCGLPVLACINPGNDLIQIIADHDVGIAFLPTEIDRLSSALDSIVTTPENIGRMKASCLSLANDMFSAKAIVGQIIDGLSR